MADLRNLPTDDLRAYRERVQEQYDALRAQKRSLNLGRGKPSPEQLDLSNGLLTILGANDVLAADGTDCRNYGGLQGLPEARALFATMLGTSADRVIVAGNSSLEIMHDTVEWASLRGVPGSAGPWSAANPATFLCPVPGYDRHFTICDGLGIKMVPVPLTGSGPDMDVVERLVASDPGVKGIWCVPKYSNPTGDVYSAEVAERLARMPTAAADFRIFWDNAYGVHHLTSRRHEIADIMALCETHGHPDRAFVFASTSKMTFAGAGVAIFASSPANVKWLLQQMERRTIGADKLNQLRHVRFLKDEAGIRALMEGHAKSLLPKFREVQDIFERLLGGTGVASWTEPDGGYFISFDVLDGCARRVIELAKQAGITVVPAGSTFPYGKDPNDRNIRIAPSFPSLDEVTKAAEGLALATLVAASDAILAQRGEHVSAPVQGERRQIREKTRREKKDGVLHPVHPSRYPSSRKPSSLFFLLSLSVRYLNLDWLCALPQGHLAELGEPFAPEQDREEVVAGELARLAREVRVAVRNEHLGLADAAGIEDDLSRMRIRRGVLGAQSEIEAAERHPHRLAAPAHVQQLLTERQELAKRLAGARRRRFEVRLEPEPARRDHDISHLTLSALRPVPRRPPGRQDGRTNRPPPVTTIRPSA